MLDPVPGLRKIEAVKHELLELKKETPYLNTNLGGHPVEYLFPVLCDMRNKMLTEYGAMMWESPDEAINQPYSKEYFPELSKKIQTKVHRRTEKEEDS